MPERNLLYIECDGQVYLVRRNGVWTFPSADETLPFEHAVRHSTSILGAKVSFCRPEISHFPADWMFKDDVPVRTDVDPVVQRAINASIARCVVGLILVNEKDEVLMVKSSRGFTKGMWNVPGGFIEYGEAPEAAAVREAKEETGLDVATGELLGVFTERFESPYFMYGFMYAGRPRGGTLRPDPSEIESVQWMTPEEAMASTRNPFATKALAKRFRIPLPAASPPTNPPRGKP